MMLESSNLGSVVINSNFFARSSTNNCFKFRKKIRSKSDTKSSYFTTGSICDNEKKDHISQECENMKDMLDSDDICSQMDELVDSDYKYIGNQNDELSQQFESNSESINVCPLFNISPRIMPVSPHYVVEEEFKHNPWAMFVATIFLTKTTAKTAKPFMNQFFLDFPTPHDVLNVSPVNLEPYFEMLGLRKRSYMIWKMTYQFVSAKWRRASDLYGIGKYGEDAYRIFCLGHTDVEPTDRKLKLYMDWLKTQTDNLKEWSRADSECLIVDPVSSYYAITLK